MSVDRVSVSSKKAEQEAEWDHWERRSTRIALAIALMPIPIALVISWCLGSPPWQKRPGPAVEEQPPFNASPAPGRPGHGPR